MLGDIPDVKFHIFCIGMLCCWFRYPSTSFIFHSCYAQQYSGRKVSHFFALVCCVAALDLFLLGRFNSCDAQQYSSSKVLHFWHWY